MSNMFFYMFRSYRRCSESNQRSRRQSMGHNMMHAQTTHHIFLFFSLILLNLGNSLSEHVALHAKINNIHVCDSLFSFPNANAYLHCSNIIVTLFVNIFVLTSCCCKRIPQIMDFFYCVEYFVAFHTQVNSTSLRL